MKLICLISIVILIALVIDLYYPSVIKSKSCIIHNKNAVQIPNLIVQQVFQDKIYCSMGYCIYVSEDKGRTFKKLFKVKIDLTSFKILGNSKILRKLTNYYEFLELKILKSGTMLIFCDNKIYKKDYKKDNLRKVHKMREFDKNEVRRVMPFGIAEDQNGYVYYGEYTRNTNKDEISLYRSVDDGDTWEVYYTFHKNDIRHIHSIQYDKFSNSIWVTTGDLDNECIIGYFGKKGRFIKVFEGQQKYRCVSLVFDKHYIYWAMDSTNCKNHIFRCERDTYNVIEECEVDGPVYYGVKLENGDILFETAVEGGKGEWDANASIWIKKNNEKHFYRVFSFRKNPKIKKRANIRFAKGKEINKIMFTVMNTEKYQSNTIILDNKIH